MGISRKKIKQARRLYPAKSVKEIAGMLAVNADELVRALREEGLEFKSAVPSRFPRAKVRWKYLLLLALCVAAVYANSLENTFHYDDYHSLTENIHMRKLGKIPRYFVDAQMFSSKPGVKMVRPLLLTSFALNYALTKYNAWSWELVNVLIHLFNVLIAYVLLVHMTGKQRFALIASLVFALHPVNTESVNYVNCRSTLLVSSCMIVSLYGFVRAMLTRERLWFGVYYGFFAIGFLFKEEAIVVLALAAVIDILFLRKAGPKNGFERILLYYLPLLIIIAVYFSYRRYMMGIMIQEHPPREFIVNLMTESRVITRYFNLLVWPFHLNTSYDVEVFRDLIKDKVLPALLYISAWALAAILVWKKYPVFTFFVMAFFITLAPTALVPLNATMNEHRLYLATLALGILMSRGLTLAEKNSTPLSKAASNSVLILLFALLGCLVVARNRLWVSDMILWRDAIAKSPAKAQVISDLGNAYFRQSPPNIDRAEQLYKWSIMADRLYFKAYHNLAIINFSRGDRVLDTDPELARQYYRNSVAFFQDAVRIYPWNPDSWNDMGTAYLKLGDYDNARLNYQKAMDMDPNYFKGHYNMGYSFSLEKKFAEAEQAFKGALKIYDRDPKLWFGLSNAQFQQKKYEAALETMRQGMTILPDSSELKQGYERLFKFIEDLRSGKTAPPP